MPSPCDVRAVPTARPRPDRPGGRFSDRSLNAVLQLARVVGGVGPLRRPLAAWMERGIRARANRGATRHPLAVEQDKVAIGLALLAAAERGFATGQLGVPALRALLGNLYGGCFLRRRGTGEKDRFADVHGERPGDFLVISPGKACNLRCEGCYANSGAHREKLSWPVLERLVGEAHDRWGNHFFVISGGEPLAYRDEGKGVLDLAERFPDCFFVMYTNGTLIDGPKAQRMGRLGNLSPALSVEGLRESTDARRGAGVFDAVLRAMDRLREQGVVYGISLTATRRNCEEILSDAVVDAFFEEMGALYAFVFHYMPMGRAYTLDLMMTPEQRFALFQRVWSLMRERHIFIADFWNSATASGGCLAAGRAGGYFHVNWNGDASPCVFFPYAPKNVNRVFAEGEDLDTVWADPFFADIRRWQRDYGYREPGEACAPRCGNWMAPCLIRDHHADALAMMREHRPAPVDDDARAALEDADYHAGLERFDREYAALTDPVWQHRYLESAGIPPAPMQRR